MSDMVGLHKSNSVSSHVASALKHKECSLPSLDKSLLLPLPFRSNSHPGAGQGREWGRGAGGAWRLCVTGVQMLQQELIHPKELEKGTRPCCGPALKEPCKFTKQITIYYISSLEQSTYLSFRLLLTEIWDTEGQVLSVTDREAKA